MNPRKYADLQSLDHLIRKKDGGSNNISLQTEQGLNFHPLKSYEPIFLKQYHRQRVSKIVIVGLVALINCYILMLTNNV